MRRFLLLPIAIAVLLAGCAAPPASPAPSQPAPAQPAPPQAAATQPAAPKPATTQAPAAAPAVETNPNATLRIAYQFKPVNLDPAQASGSYSAPTLYLAMDRLVHVTPEGDLTPGLATSWEFADNNQSLVFKLRPNVKFQDGTPVDAAAVKVNLDRYRGVTFDKSAFVGDLAAIEAIDVVDPLTVKLRIKAGQGAVNLPYILSERPGLIASPASIAKPGFDQLPVGSGMFKITSYNPGSKVVFERWDGYWDPNAVKVARVELSYLTDAATRLRGLQSGEFDYILIDPSQADEVQRGGFGVVEGRTFSYFRVQLNRSREWFAKKEVREALNLAVDRDAIVKGVLFGRGESTIQPFPKGFWAHNPQVTPDRFKRDLARAKQLLSTAGYPNGFAFDCFVVNNPFNVQLAEAVKAQLAEVGVNMKINQVDNPTQNFYTRKEGDAWLGQFGGRADPAETIILQYSAGKLQNPGGDSPAGMADLVKQVSTPIPQADRAKLIHSMVSIIADQALDLILYTPSTIQVFSKKVVGIKNWMTDKPEFRGVAIAK